MARRRVRYEANGPPAEPKRLAGWPDQRFELLLDLFVDGLAQRAARGAS